MSLAEKREQIITEHKAQEKYDPHWKLEAEKGRKISERPVAFVCDDQIVVTGDCVAKVRAGIEAFFEKVGADRDTLIARLSSEPAFYQAVEKCRSIIEAEPNGDLRLPQQSWNAVAYALNEAGCDVVLADGKVSVPVSVLDLLRQGKRQEAQP